MIPSAFHQTQVLLKHFKHCDYYFVCANFTMETLIEERRPAAQSLASEQEADRLIDQSLTLSTK